MNNRIRKEVSELFLNGEQIFCMEKALYALTDKFKHDRINGKNTFVSNYDKIIHSCFEILKQHENLHKNREVYDLYLENELNMELDTEEVENKGVAWSLFYA